jgi:hypothetical protein
MAVGRVETEILQDALQAASLANARRERETVLKLCLVRCVAALGKRKYRRTYGGSLLSVQRTFG